VSVCSESPPRKASISSLLVTYAPFWGAIIRKSSHVPPMTPTILKMAMLRDLGHELES
jgi:hypothetical protein